MVTQPYGEWAKSTRIALGLSQGKLRKRIVKEFGEDAAIKLATIKGIENGRSKNPDEATRAQLSFGLAKPNKP